MQLDQSVGIRKDLPDCLINRLSHHGNDSNLCLVADRMIPFFAELRTKK